MLRGFASKCLDPISPRGTASPSRVIWRDTVSSSRRFYERRRRSGDGRKRDWWEERSAANQDEYFRKVTARQLKEIRERGVKRKAERDQEIESERQEKTRRIQENPEQDVRVVDESTTKLQENRSRCESKTIVDRSCNPQRSSRRQDLPQAS
ncbi:unnamed protein product [Xylocopa violacea]|uniref:Uncharacterized protein n=1 Tax=Xylocopa violacea TaxID=135666 RepID=A0ABP1NE84_XYLVO